MIKILVVSVVSEGTTSYRSSSTKIQENIIRVKLGLIFHCLKHGIFPNNDFKF